MAYLATKNGTEKYRNRVRNYIDEFVDFGEWKLLATSSPRPVIKRASNLLAGGMAPRTVNARLTAVKGFTRWLVPDQWHCDPLAGGEETESRTDRRLVRRMLLPTEWPHLRDATEHAGRMPDFRARAFDALHVGHSDRAEGQRDRWAYLRQGGPEHR